jgi:hypothetical protein
MLASDHASPGGRDDRRAARPLGSGEPRCQHVDACGRPCESSALGPPYGSGSSALAVDLPRRSAFRGGAGNQWEREELGIDKASYFFWGCGAYPKGTVALLLEGMPSGVSCTATPFDTGGCESGCFLRAGQSLSDAERRATLDRFMLENGARAAEYGAHYIADLFDDPLDYVRLPQHSRPPRLPVHELSSPTDDRRAWTIEVRFHGDVPVPPERLRKVVLRRRDQFRELPPRYRRIAVVSSREDDFGQEIAAQVLS